MTSNEKKSFVFKIDDIPIEDKEKIITIMTHFSKAVRFVLSKIGRDDVIQHFKMQFLILDKNPEFKESIFRLQESGSIEELQHYLIFKDDNGKIEKIKYWITKTDIVETSNGYEIDFGVIAANVVAIAEDLCSVELDEIDAKELVEATISMIQS